LVAVNQAPLHRAGADRRTVGLVTTTVNPFHRRGNLRVSAAELAEIGVNHLRAAKAFADRDTPRIGSSATGSAIPVGEFQSPVPSHCATIASRPRLENRIFDLSPRSQGSAICLSSCPRQVRVPNPQSRCAGSPAPHNLPIMVARIWQCLRILVNETKCGAVLNLKAFRREEEIRITGFPPAWHLYE